MRATRARSTITPTASVTIELASEDIDETDMGRNVRTLSGIMSRMERVEIRRRTQRGRKARVAGGKMLTAAFPLYGYLCADPEKGQRTRYIIDPETAPVVVRIFERAADGVSIRQIERELETERVPTPFQVLDARDAARWPHSQSHLVSRNRTAHAAHSRLLG